jgi:hypothetical protein
MVLINQRATCAVMTKQQTNQSINQSNDSASKMKKRSKLNKTQTFDFDSSVDHWCCGGGVGFLGARRLRDDSTTDNKVKRKQHTYTHELVADVTELLLLPTTSSPSPIDRRT